MTILRNIFFLQNTQWQGYRNALQSQSGQSEPRKISVWNSSIRYDVGGRKGRKAELDLDA